MIMIWQCRHPRVEPARTLDGEIVGRVCAWCLIALPVSWRCPACSWEEVRVADRRHPVALVQTWACEDHAGTV